MSIETRMVEVGDVSLAIDETGVGGRPLLLVHGFTGSRTDFTLALDDLAASGWHVVVPDLRGHGLSSHPADEAAYSLDIFAGDVLGLADALGFERFTLLGHSMGGMVAQCVALRAPARVEALVLMDTSHGPLALPPEAVSVIVDVARHQGIDAVADLMEGTPSPLETQAYLDAVERDPAYRERGNRNRRASSAAMFAAMVTELTTQSDRLRALCGLAMPVLVIVGEQDEPFLADSRRMADAIPGARLAVVAGGGHSPQFEAPDAPRGWWAALSGFLDTLPVG